MLGHLQGDVNLDAQVTRRTLDFRITQEQLDSPEILGAPIDQGGLWSHLPLVADSRQCGKRRPEAARRDLEKRMFERMRMTVEEQQTKRGHLRQDKA